MAVWGYDVESDGRLPRGKIVVACAVQEGRETEPFFFWDNDSAAEFLSGLTEDDTLIGHNLKFDIRCTGVIPKARILDSLVASWLYDPSGQHGLKHLAAEVLGTPLEDPIKVRDGVVYWGDYKTLIRDADLEEVKRYCYEDVLATMQLARLYESLLDEHTLQWYWKWEEPFIKSLAQMESKGLLLDEEKRQQLADQMQLDLDRKRVELFQMVGYAFNTESPQQLGKVLYTKSWEDKERGLVGYYKRCEHHADASKCRTDSCSGPRPKTGWVPTARKGLGLRPASRTDSGQPGTDSTALEAHADHPVVAKLLEVRELQKLLSTYLLAYPEYTHEGRLYGNFNGCGTQTGRLSSSQPNFQNQPARGHYGKLLRSLFIAAPGYKLVVADLSAIEFRLIAEFSGEPLLLDAFANGDDVHQVTADANGIERHAAKTFGYGLVYEAGARTAARALHMLVKAVKPMWQKFNASLPRVAEWKEEVKAQTRAQGFVELPSGRRRYLPDINSYDQQRRGYAERQAVNTWPQGSAADLLKVSQVLLQQHGWTASAQVHDELIFEVPEAQAEEVAALVKQVMESAGEVFGFKVPIVCEPKVCSTWADKD